MFLSKLNFIKRRAHASSKRHSIIDSYQESLNKLGKEQLKSLLERGIELQPVGLAG